MAESNFHRLLKIRVAEEVEKRSISLANGEAADYPKYQQSVGYILGLKDALKLCEDIERDTER